MPGDTSDPTHARGTDRGTAPLSRRALLGTSALAVGSAALVSATSGSATAASAASTDAASHCPRRGPVRTHSGLVTGTESLLPGVTVYKGIPYAASTAGDRRWRAPGPAPRWSGIRHAETWGPACPQPLDGLPDWVELPEFSEDCLNLNVWTAAGSDRERRPVFMWLYGGGTTACGPPSRCTTAPAWPARAWSS